MPCALYVLPIQAIHILNFNILQKFSVRSGKIYRGIFYLVSEYTITVTSPFSHPSFPSRHPSLIPLSPIVPCYPPHPSTLFRMALDEDAVLWYVDLT